MRHVKLVKRELNCESVTKEDFIKFVREDFLKANHKYVDLYAPEFEENIKRGEQYRIDKMVNDVKKSIEKNPPKRTSTIQKKINKAIEDAKKINEEERKKYAKGYNISISFFDFDIYPGDNGSPSTSCVSESNLSDEYLERVYNTVKDNKYFKNAYGWIFEYETMDNTSFRSAFRPQIKMLLTEEFETMYKDEKETLEKAIASFYRNTTYFGD